MFQDRADAALKLCPKLSKFKGQKNTFVAGLTRGGVITAKVIAKNLKIKLKAIAIKKIGAPGNSELAVGAIISANDIFWNEDLCKEYGIDNTLKKKLVLEKKKELENLRNVLNIQSEDKEYKGKTVILTDDGVATGISIITAAKYLRKCGAKKIILATPVIAIDTLRSIKEYFDNIVYLLAERDFYSVSQFYYNFEQISDEKVAKILKS